MGQVIRLQRPWVESNAGWRAARVEVDRRVARWRRQRALEAWLWALPMTALAVALDAATAGIARARAAAGGGR